MTDEEKKILLAWLDKEIIIRDAALRRTPATNQIQLLREAGALRECYKLRRNLEKILKKFPLE